MRGSFSTVLVAAVVLALTFLMLPIAAIFLNVSPGAVLHQMQGEVVRDAMLVSLKTNVIADIIIVIVGTPAAYFVATRRVFPGRRILITLFELPLVLPPAVAGIGLLVAFGRAGVLGGQFAVFGVSIPFTQAAVVLAIIFVAGPFYLRQAIASFESVDPGLINAARTLGAGPWRTFRKVALPLAASGLAAGWALAFARGMGEFGATIIFAGNFEGVTQTLPLAVYAQMDQNFDTALAIAAILIIISACILLAVKLIPSWNPTASSSPTSGRRSATSSLTSNSA